MAISLACPFETPKRLPVVEWAYPEDLTAGRSQPGSLKSQYYIETIDAVILLPKDGERRSIQDGNLVHWGFLVADLTVHCTKLEN